MTETLDLSRAIVNTQVRVDLSGSRRKFCCFVHTREARSTPRTNATRILRQHAIGSSSRGYRGNRSFIRTRRLLGDTGGSLKTAQAVLGHSDLQATLNTYTQAIPDSQRTAAERVAGFCSQMFATPLGANSGRTHKLMKLQLLRGKSGEPGRTRTCNPLIKSPPTNDAAKRR
jgi:hypothetical protein